jgi:hypothetical protein
MQPHPIVMKADWIEARRALLAVEIAGLPASRGTILRARGVDAQQIFMTATADHIDDARAPGTVYQLRRQ